MVCLSGLYQFGIDSRNYESFGHRGEPRGWATGLPQQGKTTRKQKQIRNLLSSIPRVGTEPTIAAFERLHVITHTGCFNFDSFLLICKTFVRPERTFTRPNTGTSLCSVRPAVM